MMQMDHKAFNGNSCDLRGKNIIVSGGSSGIGRQCALECSKAGARVHVLGRDEARLEEVFCQMSGEGNSRHSLDMRDTEQFLAVVDGIVKSFGKITGFIHSAGYQITSPVKAMSASQYRDIFLVNTISGFELGRIISMKKNHVTGELSIIFIAGGISVIGVTALTAYGASKAGLVGGARAMAVELAPRKICVNCVSPGYIVDTNMLGDLDQTLSEEELSRLSQGYPLGLGHTGEISAMCAYLLSDKARWITGQNIVVDGGATAQ